MEKPEHTKRTIMQLLVLFTSLAFLCISCVDRQTSPDQVHIKVGAEKLSQEGNMFLAENDSSWQISGAGARTQQENRNGDFSVLTSVKAPFALSVSIPAIGADYYFVVSIWRKSNESVAKLVVSSVQTRQLYKMTDQAVEKDADGWEKLELKFFTPADFEQQEVKINVWNNGSEEAYFDDLDIKVYREKEYPSYREEAFHIELDTSDYLSLQQVRKRAFKAGILQSRDGDWVNGFVFSDDRNMKAKMRLKGDWLDHLYGDKWSFRMKLKGNNSWRRMKIFSLQTPLARMGVNEWYLHQLCIEEDLLTTRYGFVPLTFNGKNLGIYAFEDHFTKQLIESQKRREGPIVRFVEDALWDTRVYTEEGKRNNKKVPAFEAASIKPFTANVLMEDSVKMNQFMIAQNLMLQYKNRTQRASAIFNIDALAKYFALSDVFSARHCLIWHNQRFYYNPVLCKLEPITFDCYADIGFMKTSGRKIWGFIESDSRKVIGDEYLMIRELFNDTAFVDKYISYLEKYAAVSYLNDMAAQLMPAAGMYDSLLQIEFPAERFDTAFLQENARFVRQELPEFKRQSEQRKKEQLSWINESMPPVELDTVLDDFFIPNLLQCYLQPTKNDSLQFKVVSYFPDALTILGVGKGPKRVSRFLVPATEVDAYPKEGSRQEFCIEKIEAAYLFFTRKGGDQIMSIEISLWPEPDGSPSPVQSLIADFPFAVESDLYKVKGKKVTFNKGFHTLDHPLIIPEGYEVYFGEGTTLDLTNKAIFISYSVINMKGSKEAPVRITSSDFSANGFTVLQAPGRSELRHVVFENLNTLNYKGWVLTGAVNFYESEVDIIHCRFYRNQCEDALNLVRSEFLIDDAEFDFIYGDAFDSDFSKGKLLHSEFTNIGNDAIDFSGSDILIKDSRIVGASDKGISGGEDSRLVVDHVFISNANIGLASKDLSVVDVRNSTVTDCNYGIVLLQKKPEYGPAIMMLDHTQLENLKTEQLIEEGSVVIINQERIEGTAKNVARLFY